MMIKVTSLRGKLLHVNADLIATVEATPDTVLTLTTGRRLVVMESVEELVKKFIEYKQLVVNGPSVNEVK